MAIVVSQLSETLLLSLSISLSSSIHAYKSVKLGDKNIAATYAENFKYLTQINTRLNGLNVSVSGSNVTMATGKFIYEGLVAETTDSTTIVDPGTYSSPYYIYGKITNNSTAGAVEFGFSDDAAGDFSILATNDGAGWIMKDALELGLMWSSIMDHEENDDIHSTADINLQLQSPTSATAANVYATQKDLYTYDRSVDGNDILTSLLSLIELEQNTNQLKPHRFNFNNMFADVIPVGLEIKHAGKYGTFLDAWDGNIETNVGLYGIYNDTNSEFTFETGIIKQVDDISNNIIVATKELAIGSAPLIKFDLMTNGTSYQLTDQYPNTVLDSTSIAALDVSPNGTYDIQLKFRLPVVTGGNSWAAKQTLTNETSMAGSVFLGNRLHCIGGGTNAAADAGVQSYHAESDTFSLSWSSIDRVAIASAANLELNRLTIFNSSTLAGAVDDDIIELDFQNNSISNVATGLNAWGSTAAPASDDAANALFGTGRNQAGTIYYDDWRFYNGITRAHSAKTDYPLSCMGVSSASSRSIPREVYNYGAFVAGVSQSSIISYDIYSDAFTAKTPTDIGGATSTSKSMAESAIFTLRKTLLYVGITTGEVLAEAFDFHISEYNIFQNTLTKKTNMTSGIGHNAVGLAANGKIYSLGGRTGNASPDLAKSSNWEYTPDAMIYMFGWGIEWL